MSRQAGPLEGSPWSLLEPLESDSDDGSTLVPDYSVPPTDLALESDSDDGSTLVPLPVPPTDLVGIVVDDGPHAGRPLTPEALANIWGRVLDRGSVHAFTMHGHAIIFRMGTAAQAVRVQERLNGVWAVNGSVRLGSKSVSEIR
jgi:hypothetical protein